MTSQPTASFQLSLNLFKTHFRQIEKSQLTLGSINPACTLSTRTTVKSYDKIQLLARSPHCNYNVKLQMGGPEAFIGL